MIENTAVPCRFCGEAPEVDTVGNGWDVRCINEACALNVDTKAYKLGKSEAIAIWNKFMVDAPQMRAASIVNTYDAVDDRTVFEKSRDSLNSRPFGEIADVNIAHFSELAPTKHTGKGMKVTFSGAASEHAAAQFKQDELDARRYRALRARIRSGNDIYFDESRLHLRDVGGIPSVEEFDNAIDDLEVESKRNG